MGAFFVVNVARETGLLASKDDFSQAIWKVKSQVTVNTT